MEVEPTRRNWNKQNGLYEYEVCISVAYAQRLAQLSFVCLSVDKYLHLYVGLCFINEHGLIKIDALFQQVRWVVTSIARTPNDELISSKIPHCHLSSSLFCVPAEEQRAKSQSLN